MSKHVPAVGLRPDADFAPRPEGVVRSITMDCAVEGAVEDGYREKSPGGVPLIDETFISVPFFLFCAASLDCVINL